MSNDAAKELGQRRWEGKTAEERKEHMRKMAQARWGVPKKQATKKKAGVKGKGKAKS